MFQSTRPKLKEVTKMQKFITCCHEFSNFHKRTPFFFPPMLGPRIPRIPTRSRIGIIPKKPSENGDWRFTMDLSSQFAINIAIPLGISTKEWDNPGQQGNSNSDIQPKSLYAVFLLGLNIYCPLVEVFPCKRVVRRVSRTASTKRWRNLWGSGNPVQKWQVDVHFQGYI